MDLLEKIKNAIIRFYPLDEQAWEILEPNLVVKHCKKGDLLVKEGDIEDRIFFLGSGVSRNYFLRNDKEFTIDFHFEGDFVTGFYSLITGAPSILTVELLTDAVIVVFPYGLITSLYDLSAKAANFGRLIAERQYVVRLLKEMDLMSLTAEERYAKLVDSRPGLVEKISVKHISSYLGIHPESLSRIRKKFL
ncbi:Crp/Fnr family transcriptional regulator [Flavobacterium sp. RHBU_24]|uniref:Crp/Fnr family transcriptional regulator n=1 Tax=Flavobacterium sp. RHBU_24 TaxID=3391185 RepID=UPI0039853CE5